MVFVFQGCALVTPGNPWHPTSVALGRLGNITYINYTLFTGSHYDIWKRIIILRSLLTDNPPCPGNVGLTTGVYVPFSFRIVVWVLVRPTRQDLDKWRCCETGPTVFRPYPRKANRLQMSLQGQHFLLSYLKTLSVGPAGVWTCKLPLSRPVLSQLSQPGGS